MVFGYDVFGNNLIFNSNGAFTPTIENPNLTQGLRKFSYLKDKGYCPHFTTLQENLSYNVNQEEDATNCEVEKGCGKCSTCTQEDWESRGDMGRTYILIQRDDSDTDLEGGSYLVIGMRSGDWGICRVGIHS